MFVPRTKLTPVYLSTSNYFIIATDDTVHWAIKAPMLLKMNIGRCVPKTVSTFGGEDHVPSSRRMQEPTYQPPKSNLEKEIDFRAGEVCGRCGFVSGRINRNPFVIFALSIVYTVIFWCITLVIVTLFGSMLTSKLTREVAAYVAERSFAPVLLGAHIIFVVLLVLGKLPGSKRNA